MPIKSIVHGDGRGDRAGGEGPDVGGMEARASTAPPPAEPGPAGTTNAQVVPGTMPVETYAEWHAKLTDAQKRWVAAALEGLAGVCEDPEGLVRADMASSEYALVARQHVLGSRDRPFRRSTGGSLGNLRMLAEDYGGDRGAAALQAMDRMESAGISRDDILDFHEWARFSAEEGMRTKIDEAQEFYVNGFPGWAMVEMVDDKEGGRIISGGARFNPGAYDLDPWRGERPRARPWDSRCFRDGDPEPPVERQDPVKPANAAHKRRSRRLQQPDG